MELCRFPTGRTLGGDKNCSRFHSDWIGVELNVSEMHWFSCKYFNVSHCKQAVREVAQYAPAPVRRSHTAAQLQPIHALRLRCPARLAP